MGGEDGLLQLCGEGGHVHYSGQHGEPRFLGEEGQVMENDETEATDKKNTEPGTEQEKKPKGRHYVLEIQDAVHGTDTKKLGR